MKSSAAALTHAIKCDLASEVLLSSGTLRICVTGWSMFPVVRPGDTLRIDRAVSDDVGEGDIVLFARNRRFFVHRVVKKSTRDSSLQTRGDAMAQPDPPLADSELLGKVALILRDGKSVNPRRKKTLAQRAVSALIGRSATTAWATARVHGIYHSSPATQFIGQSSPIRSSNYRAFPCQS